MRTLARLLLLIAALVYGAMPLTGMAGMPAMAMPMSADAGEMAGMAHEAMTGQAGDGAMNTNCPHEDPSPEHPNKAMDHFGCGFCPACLILPVAVAIADGGPPARAAEAATLPRSMLSRITAPLTPPPRA